MFYDCLKEKSLGFTIVAEGLGESYTNLKSPFGIIAYLRPTITLLYLIIAALMFMAAVDRRKPLVYGMVLLAGLIVAGAISQSLAYYVIRNHESPAGCKGEVLVERSLGLMAEDVVKIHAQNLQAVLNKTDGVWRVSVRADRRALNYSYRFKKPIPTDEDFFRGSSLMQKQLLADTALKNGGRGRN